MQDDNTNTEKEILIDSSVNETTEENKAEISTISNDEKKGLLNEIKSERDKRHELESKMAELENRLNTSSTNSNQNDDDLERAADALTPILQKRGFMTSAQREDEARADKYANELKDLSSKYNGSDGRPTFDPSEIADYAKQNGIFNLEAAYRNKYWKELVDFEKKQNDSGYVETERPNSPSQSKPNERVLLTREYLEKRMAEPDGMLWYDKNIDKIKAAMAKGQL